MKVFISQPMRSKTDEYIKAERNSAIEMIKSIYPNEEIEILDSFFEGAPHSAKPLWFLGKSLEILSNADLAYFIGNWGEDRGCRLEHFACNAYGIRILTEEERAYIVNDVLVCKEVLENMHKEEHTEL